MYAALLMAMIVAGAGQAPVTSADELSVAPVQCCTYSPSDPQRNPDCVCGAVGWFFDWFKPMPQTCYSPTYGCYPGNGRDIQRYPAFHGTYYRRAYNYRQLYEWPWQAEPHEPIAYSAQVITGPTGSSTNEYGIPVTEEPTPRLENIPSPIPEPGMSQPSKW